MLNGMIDISFFEVRHMCVDENKGSPQKGQHI